MRQPAVSHGRVHLDGLPQDVLAFDSLGSIATIGVFGPAAVLVALVVYAVVRDRRRHPRDDESSEASRTDGDHVNRPPRAG